ncbi:methyltransferase domain-containing protein [Apiospora marii]|uniref:Methyltransferase domain-containing protein n=1 Tax=Apiospora marii TaxID=335849 RepID=A0ABR1T1E2_9PEZI
MAEVTELNRSHFNNEASNYDSKFQKTIQQLTEAIQERLDFIGVDWVADEDEDEDDAEEPDGADQGNGTTTATPSPSREVRLLDYACGTGLMSRALAPYTTQCVGVDISEGMVDVYNATAQNQGLAEDEMHAVVGDVTVPDDPSPAALAAPRFFGFDLAALGLGFHHFADPPLAARRLVERLRPGGVLLILDFVTHEPIVKLGDEENKGHGHGRGHGHGHDGDKAFHNAAHTVTHHGFSESQMKGIFEAAGAGRGFAFQEMGSGVVFTHGSGKDGSKRRVFLARGEKA